VGWINGVGEDDDAIVVEGFEGFLEIGRVDLFGGELVGAERDDGDLRSWRGHGWRR
jgi:hypothetical protein